MISFSTLTRHLQHLIVQMECDDSFVFEQWLDAGGTFDTPMNPDSGNVLTLALETSNLYWIKHILDAGCPVSQTQGRSPVETPPLVLLLQRHVHLDLFPCFLDAGADVLEQSERLGGSAFHYAATCIHDLMRLPHQSIKDRLAAHSCVDALGETPLHWSMISGKDPVRWDLLVSLGVDPHHLNAFGEHALFSAVRQKNTTALKHLKSYRMDPNIKNVKQDSMLHWLLDRFSFSALKLFLDAHVELQDDALGVSVAYKIERIYQQSLLEGWKDPDLDHVHGYLQARFEQEAIHDMVRCI